MRGILRYVLFGTLLISTAVFLNNTDLLVTPPTGEPDLLAHRGVHQRYDRTGLESDTCTAARIFPPVHDYLENTIRSIRAAFEAGADVVEFDIHPTTDGQFAIFHDWTLDCRTDGKGVTRDHSMEDLKKLDIGYGYTADDGETYPFRGKGIGEMPTLDEVLAAFPNRRFLINVKSDDPAEGKMLADRLAALPPERRTRLMAYGGNRPIAELRKRLPEMKTMSRKSLKSCLLSYIALGRSGHVPRSCRGELVLVPINVAPWLWGWPHRFLERMSRAGSFVFAVGPIPDHGFSTGLDNPSDLARLPKGYTGGIWTDDILNVAKLVWRNGEMKSAAR